MSKIKIADIQKVRHQATGADFLDVEVHIFEEQPHTITQEDLDRNEGLSEEVKVGDEVTLPVVVSTQKHAFDPTISKEELTAKVEAILAGYVLEQEQKEANAEENAVNENVYDLQAELVGKEIGVETKVEDKKG